MENLMYVLLAVAVFALGVGFERLRASGALHLSFAKFSAKPAPKKKSGKKRKPAAANVTPTGTGKRGRPRKSETGAPQA